MELEKFIEKLAKKGDSNGCCPASLIGAGYYRCIHEKVSLDCRECWKKALTRFAEEEEGAFDNDKKELRCP